MLSQYTPSSVRQTMCVLGPSGSVAQKVLTRLTCEPLDSSDVPRTTAARVCRHSLLALGGGALAAAFAWQAGGAISLLVIPATVLTLHGARSARAVVMHQAAHRNLFGREPLDRRVGQVLSILLISESFDGYAQSHLRPHHGADHQTLADPTVAFHFDQLGLRAGMAPQEMWRRLLTTLVSPAYHLRFAASRILSHFAGTSVRYRVAVAAYLAALAGAILSPLGDVVAIAWIVPLFPLLQVISALRLCTEHQYPEALPDRRGRATLGLFTSAIFVGDRAPDPTLPTLRRAIAWIGWWMRLLLWHLPLRLMVLPGDGPTQDLHHQEPQLTDWPNHIAERARRGRKRPDTRAVPRDLGREGRDRRLLHVALEGEPRGLGERQKVSIHWRMGARVGLFVKPISFNRHRFQAEMIRQAVWLCSRFTLSIRDVEELLAQRGIEVCRETVRCWAIKFGPLIAADLRPWRHPQKGPRIWMRSMFGSAKKIMWLRRAIEYLTQKPSRNDVSS